MTDPYTQEQDIMDGMTRKMIGDGNKVSNPRGKNARLRRKEYRDKYDLCKYCGATENLTVDHKIPLSIGGVDNQKNWQVLCGECNRTKSGLTHKEVMRLFRWFSYIQQNRIDNNMRPLRILKHKNVYGERQSDT